MKSFLEGLIASAIIAIATAVVGFVGFDFKSMFSSYPYESILIFAFMVIGGSTLWRLGGFSKKDTIDKLETENDKLSADLETLNSRFLRLNQVTDEVKTKRTIAMTLEDEDSWLSSSK